MRFPQVFSVLNIAFLLLSLSSSIHASNSKSDSHNKIENMSARNSSSVHQLQCDVVLRYVDGLGLGVYAGKTFQVNDVINEIVGIPVLKTATSYNILENYVDGVSDTHDIIYLGYAMLFNHAPLVEGRMTGKATRDSSKVHYESRKQSELYNEIEEEVNEFNFGFMEPDSWSHDRNIVAEWVIFEGDQIFSYYGDHWFSNKKFPEMRTRQQTNRDILHIDDIHDTKRPKPQSSYDNNNTATVSPNTCSNSILSSKSKTKHSKSADSSKRQVKKQIRDKPVTSHRVPGCTTLLTTYDTATQTLRAARDISAGTFIEVARALLVPEFSQLKPGPLQQFLWWNPHLQSTEASKAATKQVYESNKASAALGSSEENLSHRQQLLINNYAINAHNSTQYFTKLAPKRTIPSEIPAGMNLINKHLFNDSSAYDHTGEDWAMIVLGNGALYSGVSGQFASTTKDVTTTDDEGNKETYKEVLQYFSFRNDATLPDADDGHNNDDDNDDSDGNEDDDIPTVARKVPNVVYDYWNAYDVDEFDSELYLRAFSSGDGEVSAGGGDDSCLSVDSGDDTRKSGGTSTTDGEAGGHKTTDNKSNDSGDNDHNDASTKKTNKNSKKTKKDKKKKKKKSKRDTSISGGDGSDDSVIKRYTTKGEECRSAMMISFVASRDILEGEELVIDLLVDTATGRRYAHPDFATQCM